jgi:hypothetical protein
MKNITELRDELGQVFHELRDGSLSAKEASEINNSAGKIINTLKVELEYYHLAKEKPDIKYFK